MEQLISIPLKYISPSLKINIQFKKSSTLKTILHGKQCPYTEDTSNSRDLVYYLTFIFNIYFRLMRRDDDEELEELNNQIEALR